MATDVAGAAAGNSRPSPETTTDAARARLKAARASPYIQDLVNNAGPFSDAVKRELAVLLAPPLASE